jgi:hypothetical protein
MMPQSQREREQQDSREESLSDNVEASGRDTCLCQKAVAIIEVNQGTSGPGEKSHDALL